LARSVEEQEQMPDRKVRDTSTKEEAAMTMADAAVMGTNRAIEAQEAHGQSDFVNSTQLPVRGSDDEAFAKMGIIFAVAVEGELFRHADLPAGWSKKPTDHSMWSHLVDNNGNVRASIFYKAAFYDRDAFMRPDRRFKVGNDYDYAEEHPGKYRICVFDVWGGKETVRFQVDVSCADKSKWYREKEPEARAKCESWLAENYPEWEDASAHWEAE